MLNQTEPSPTTPVSLRLATLNTQQDSEYFSISLHKHMRLEYFRLCGRGWSVGEKALRFYRHGDGSAVGAVRAER